MHSRPATLAGHAASTLQPCLVPSSDSCHGAGPGRYTVGPEAPEVDGVIVRGREAQRARLQRGNAG